LPARRIVGTQRGVHRPDVNLYLYPSIWLHEVISKLHCIALDVDEVCLYGLRSGFLQTGKSRTTGVTFAESLRPTQVPPHIDAKIDPDKLIADAVT